MGLMKQKSGLFNAIDACNLEKLLDDRQSAILGEGAETGAEFDVEHGTVCANGDIRYIAMQFSGLYVF